MVVLVLSFWRTARPTRRRSTGMPFMVMYQRSDGTSGFEQADAVDEAAMFVERLRNRDGIEADIRIYRMEEVSFAFRPYYKVELEPPERQPEPTPSPGVAGMTPPVVEERAPAPVAPPAPVPVVAGALVDPTPVPEAGDAGANGRRGLFGR
jgi:hypothetical protein